MALRPYLFLLLLILYSPALGIAADNLPPKLAARLGSKDSLLVLTLTNETILEFRADHKRIPASTLKLFTALFALEELGSAYRFPTDFFLDDQKNLTVRGYGDPLLLSEVLPRLAQALSRSVSHINTIILDDTYFDDRITIPGAAHRSVEPYDAPNGALCVNFNSVFFKKDTRGRFVSAEPQTPLLPFVLPRIEASTLPQGRIILLGSNHEPTYYAGHLLGYFFKGAGISWGGALVRKTGEHPAGQLVYRHHSPYSMEEIIAKMLYFSNNFTANQLFLAAGAHRHGPPASLDKSVSAATRFAKEKLGIEEINLVEGSGLSRANRVSARTLGKVLIAFAPYRHRMRFEKGIYYKTGTLNGVRTRVGYLETPTGNVFAFVVIVNTPGVSDWPVVASVRDYLLSTPP
jgi:D-alanyl-D-alanine carboxypeptidase/D-alanyl-D-alanine-endopeptidase (penicillin-binding protein 4)